MPEPLRWVLPGLAGALAVDLLILIALRRALPDGRTLAFHVAMWFAGIPLLVVLLGVLLPPFLVVVPPLVLAPLLVHPTEAIARQGRASFVGAALTLVAFLAAVSAPFRAAAVALHQAWEPFPAHLAFDATGWLGPRPVAGLDMGIALCGLLLGVVGGHLGVRRVWRQARQIDNLPTSKVRAAAIGLAEFKGIARAADPSRAVPREEPSNVPGWPVDLRQALLFTGTASVGGRSASAKKWSAFYLEDETGRILVDPRGAEFWDGHGDLMLESIRTIHLELRHRPLPGGHEMAARLAPGDRVYLVGSVEPDPEAAPGAADSERLIVRPRRRPATGFLDRLLPFENVLPGADAEHVFFLSATSERGAAAVLRRAAVVTVIASFIWLVASSWLAGTRLAGYTSLPAGFLSAAIHQEREDGRRREVLRSLTRVTPDSADAVPRLVEALGDPDPLVRKEAVLALYRVKGAPRPPAVIPVLIELLRWQDPTTYDQPTRNGAALRLGDLGQAAAPAIPVLIESLGHRDALVRYHALRGLAGIGVFDERVVPAFARALADPAPAVRRQAVVGLEQMGDAVGGAAPALERAQGDEDPAVRERARRLLRRLAG